MGRNIYIERILIIYQRLSTCYLIRTGSDGKKRTEKIPFSYSLSSYPLF